MRRWRFGDVEWPGRRLLCSAEPEGGADAGGAGGDAGEAGGGEDDGGDPQPDPGAALAQRLADQERTIAKLRKITRPLEHLAQRSGVPLEELLGRLDVRPADDETPAEPNGRPSRGRAGGDGERLAAQLEAARAELERRDAELERMRGTMTDVQLERFLEENMPGLQPKLRRIALREARDYWRAQANDAGGVSFDPVDPRTGQLVTRNGALLSAEQFAEDFRKAYPELFTGSRGAGIGAPGSPTGGGLQPWQVPESEVRKDGYAAVQRRQKAAEQAGKRRPEVVPGI